MHDAPVITLRALDWGVDGSAWSFSFLRDFLGLGSVALGVLWFGEDLRISRSGEMLFSWGLFLGEPSSDSSSRVSHFLITGRLFRE